MFSDNIINSSLIIRDVRCGCSVMSGNEWDRGTRLRCRGSIAISATGYIQSSAENARGPLDNVIHGEAKLGHGVIARDSLDISTSTAFGERLSPFSAILRRHRSRAITGV